MKTTKWLIEELGDFIHILPEIDVKPHAIMTERENRAEVADINCPCKPSIIMGVKMTIVHNSFSDNEVCMICKYGDGKWKLRMGHKMPDIQQICELCKKDGWSNATHEDFENDTDLKGKIGLSINPDLLK